MHINGKHNFVSLELCDECGQRRFEAENEWTEMYLFYGIDNHDGTISYYYSKGWDSRIYSEEEFYELHPDVKVFDSSDDYSR